MSKPKQNNYQVHVKATVYFYADIKADSLEEALQKGRALSFHDLWEVPGDVVDSEHEIEGVSKA